MMTLFTAVGTYEFRKDRNGMRYPVVVSNGKELELDPQEQIIWFSLLWKIHTYPELKEKYRHATCELNICQEANLDSYLSRMEFRGLLAVGRDYTGIDALYSLLSRLTVVYKKDSLLLKVLLFVSYVLRGKSFRMTRRIFQRVELLSDERQVLGLACQQILSTAEIIKCVQVGIKQIGTPEALVELLYGDGKSTSDDIHIESRFSSARNQVLEAVVGLLHKKVIMLDKAE